MEKEKENVVVEMVSDALEASETRHSAEELFIESVLYPDIPLDERSSRVVEERKWILAKNIQSFFSEPPPEDTESNFWPLGCTARFGIALRGPAEQIQRAKERLAAQEVCDYKRALEQHIQRLQSKKAVDSLVSILMRVAALDDNLRDTIKALVKQCSDIRADLPDENKESLPNDERNHAAKRAHPVYRVKPFEDFEFYSEDSSSSFNDDDSSFKVMVCPVFSIDKEKKCEWVTAMDKTPSATDSSFPVGCVFPDSDELLLCYSTGGLTAQAIVYQIDEKSSAKMDSGSSYSISLPDAGPLSVPVACALNEVFVACAFGDRVIVFVRNDQKEKAQLHWLTWNDVAENTRITSVALSENGLLLIGTGQGDVLAVSLDLDQAGLIFCAMLPDVNPVVGISTVAENLVMYSVAELAFYGAQVRLCTGSPNPLMMYVGRPLHVTRRGTLVFTITKYGTVNVTTTMDVNVSQGLRPPPNYRGFTADYAPLAFAHAEPRDLTVLYSNGAMGRFIID